MDSGRQKSKFLLSVVAVNCCVYMYVCAVCFKKVMMMPPITVLAEFPSVKNIDDNGMMLLIPLATSLVMQPWYAVLYLFFFGKSLYILGYTKLLCMFPSFLYIYLLFILGTTCSVVDAFTSWCVEFSHDCESMRFIIFFLCVLFEVHIKIK